MIKMFAVATMLVLAGPAFGGDVKEFYDKKCKLCHTLAGESGKKAHVGGELDDIGSKRDEEWLRKYLTEPKSALPDSKMKKIKMEPADLEAMVKFMAAQKKPK